MPNKSFFINIMLVTSALLFTSAYPATSLGTEKCSAVFSEALDSKGTSPLAPKPYFRRLFDNVYRWHFKKDPRSFTQEEFNYLNDYHYLKEKKKSEKAGIVRSIFSKEFDTRIFFTATGLPNQKGELPLVDPESRGLFIYFHGSGTNKASGINFAYKMNKMAAMGYSMISIDLPYHSEGSRNPKMRDAKVFYAMLDTFIRKTARKDMPVYLVGHSFGPDVMAEYFKRYPHNESLSGIAMISPAGFTKELKDWFIEKTAHMSALWGEVIVNEDGSAWAGAISSQHTWHRPPTTQSPDPTVVNPRVKVLVVTGEREEYVPGPLDHRGLPTKDPRTYDMERAVHNVLAGAEVVIEPGVGHYIFEHVDKNGHDVVIRSMLQVAGESLFNEKQLKATSNFLVLPEPKELARKYAREASFNSWINTLYPNRESAAEAIYKIMTEGDNITARKLLTNYSKYVIPQRDKALARNLKHTQTWNEFFYRKHKEEIDALNPEKGRPSDKLLSSYFEMLEAITERARQRSTTVPTDVYTVPEKQGPPAHILEKIEREKRQKEQKNEGFENAPAA
ncbi:alpha/beta hydrolase [Bdellovibrio bacteriovorus]|uniref:Alpha/beta fold family hydrolase n=1 Tax=Bdellovibrio bacteriovorus str. Tiberius TaxID=1069642 RepID=K7YLY9_BDEBC|nr:alpha/beta hydrolase [Bdellovibrio bacteriovorus]AFY00806.1 alpha/beta fold family hydrolase [Bdellovibrio bacteriovorus str. Tiberius]